MALFGMQNLVFGTTTAFVDTDLLLPLMATEGARFSLFPSRATMWNFTDFSSPEEARHLGTDDVEFIQIDGKSGDVLTPVQRGLEGIPAISAKLGKEYRIIVTATQAQWDKVCRAQPDGLGPFDAILNGTPAALPFTEVGRFVKGAFENTGWGIQGSPNLTTAFFIGDTTDPDQIELRTTKFAPSSDLWSLIFKGIVMLAGDGDGSLGLLEPSGGAKDGQVTVGESLTVQKLTGLREAFGIISSGIISGVNRPVIRVNAEGGPGADDLDQIDLEVLDNPFGSRVIVILEPEGGDTITVRDKSVATSADPNILLATGTTFVMSAPGDRIAVIGDTVINDEWEEIWRTPQRANLVTVKHVLAQNAASGTFTSGAFQTRPINTLIDPDGLASLAANQLTLKAGKWEIDAYVVAYQVDRHQTRLQDITGASTLIIGTSSRSNAGTFFQGVSVLKDRFTLAVDSILEIQHECSLTRAPDGFGDAANFASEVYLMATFTKIG